MSNLVDLTKDIAQDMTESDTLRAVKSRFNSLTNRDYRRYVWPAVGVIGVALIVAYGVSAYVTKRESVL